MFDFSLQTLGIYVGVSFGLLLAVPIVWMSIIRIGPNEVGLVINNYQDYQKFLDAGGRIGLQHDPLLYGSYTLNP